jgi:hypothetical protein
MVDLAFFGCFFYEEGVAGGIRGRIFASFGFYLREFEYICDFFNIFAGFRIYLRLHQAASLCRKPVISNFSVLLATLFVY